MKQAIPLHLGTKRRRPVVLPPTDTHRKFRPLAARRDVHGCDAVPAGRRARFQDAIVQCGEGSAFKSRKTFLEGRQKMLNRKRAVGEDFSNPGMATVSLTHDGTRRQYVRLGDKWYLLSFISDETKNELVSHWLPQIDYLRDLILLHREAALHLLQNVTDDTTGFQHIIISHHSSIAIFLADALLLLESGSLASSLILLRLPVELMIEIQYYKRHPSEVADYDDEVEKHNKQMQMEGKPIERRGTFRSKTIGDFTRALRKSGNPSDIESALIRTWELLSGFVSHATPELQNIAQVKPEWAWKNTFGELEQVTSSAIEQLHDVDQALGHLIDQEEELKFEERLRNLLSYGTSTSPLD